MSEMAEQKAEWGSRQRPLAGTFGGPDRPATAWDNANAEASHLQATVDQLAKSLEPVLAPAQPTAERELDVVPAELSPLGVHVETLRLIRVRIEKLLSRVDL